MAYCSTCGTQLAEGAKHCSNCGQALATTGGASSTSAPAAGTAPVRPRTEGSAIAALIFGILGLTACPVVGGIVAVILGNQAKSRIERDPTLEGEGMATAGIVMGWIAIGLGALWIVFMVFAFVASAPF